MVVIETHKIHLIVSFYFSIC